MSLASSEDQIQTALYLQSGINDPFLEEHRAIDKSHIAMLAEQDEGVMSYNSAIARISIFITELWTKNPEPAPDGLTVFEDLVKEGFAKALLNREVRNVIVKLPTRGERWEFFTDMADWIVSLWFEDEFFSISQFVDTFSRKRELPSYTVELEYFKPSGKFYSEATFETSAESWLDVITDELESVLKNDSPGLLSWKEEFMVYVNSKDHPGAFPTIRQPKK